MISKVSLTSKNVTLGLEWHKFLLPQTLQGSYELQKLLGPDV